MYKHMKSNKEHGSSALDPPEEGIIPSQEVSRCRELAAYEAGRLLNCYWFHEKQAKYRLGDHRAAAERLANKLALWARLLADTDPDAAQRHVSSHVRFALDEGPRPGYKYWNPYYDEDTREISYDPVEFKNKITKDLSINEARAFRLGQILDQGIRREDITFFLGRQSFLDSR
jgi:hypothetical protein